MLIDFHTHSTASDGALSPEELLCRATEENIALLAITDHDTDLGYRAASAHRAAAGGGPGPRLISGIEFSCVWSRVTVHVLGLGMDCDHPAIRAGVALLDRARNERACTIAARLEKLGFPGALDGAREQAGASQLGRPHFAAWMVDRGHVADQNEAFDRYLGQSKPGDVKSFWPELSEVVAWIVDAGGVAVVAHPLKYKLTRMKMRRLLGDFVDAGGGAIEILSGRQTPDQVSQLRRLALEFGLEVSMGSDFHRDGPYRPRLGVELPRTDGLQGVWERWL